MVTWVYPILILAAVAGCSFLLRRTQQKLPLSGFEKFSMGVSAFCGAMVFAKLPFLFSEFDQLLNGTVWFANGKTIMLGIVGGYLGVEFAKWVLAIQTRTGDSFSFPVAFAVSIGRLACFVGGCCYGRPTDLPWGVHFRSADGAINTLRHPTQIYEFLFHFCAAIVLYAIYRELYKGESRIPAALYRILKGNLIKIYILTYLIYRFFSEFIRPESIVEFGLTFYQLTAIVLMPTFLTLWILDVVYRPMLATPAKA